MPDLHRPCPECNDTGTIRLGTEEQGEDVACIRCDYMRGDYRRERCSLCISLGRPEEWGCVVEGVDH